MKRSELTFTLICKVKGSEFTYQSKCKVKRSELTFTLICKVKGHELTYQSKCKVKGY